MSCCVQVIGAGRMLTIAMKGALSGACVVWCVAESLTQRCVVMLVVMDEKRIASSLLYIIIVIFESITLIPDTHLSQRILLKINF